MKIKLLRILLGAALLAVAACNGVSDTVGDAVTDKPKTPDPVVPVVPVKDTTARVTGDTVMLAGDTTRRVVTAHWRGDSLLRRDTAVVPVTSFVWLVNRYGESVVMEAWTGDSLEWRNGYVLGKNLVALPDANARTVSLRDGERRRLSARPRSELLVVAGVPGTQGAQFLAARRYLAVTVADTLYVDRQGVLQRTR